MTPDAKTMLEVLDSQPSDELRKVMEKHRPTLMAFDNAIGEVQKVIVDLEASDLSPTGRVMLGCTQASLVWSKGSLMVEVATELEGLFDNCVGSASIVAADFAELEKRVVQFGTVGHVGWPFRPKVEARSVGGSLCKFNQTRNQAKKARRKLKGKK